MAVYNASAYVYLSIYISRSYPCCMPIGDQVMSTQLGYGTRRAALKATRSRSRDDICALRITVKRIANG